MSWIKYDGNIEVLRELHNVPFRAQCLERHIVGVIAIGEDTNSFLCQNIIDGQTITGFKNPYDYSWVVFDDNDLYEGHITELEYLKIGKNKLYKRVLK